MQLAEPPVVIPRHRLTVERYYRMAESGVLDPDARVELIEGEVIDMAPLLSRHARAINRLQRSLLGLAPELALQRCQLPLRLSVHSEPEPDYLLARPRPDDYGNAHPGASDTLLVVEVADSSLAYDLQVKVPLYARHGVPEVWVLDLPGRRVHRFSDPADGTYRQAQVLLAPPELPVAALPGQTVRLEGLLD